MPAPHPREQVDAELALQLSDLLGERGLRDVERPRCRRERPVLRGGEPPAGLALAALFLGEHLTLGQQAGAALVLGAIVLLQLRVRLPRRRPADVYVLPVSRAGGEPADA